MEREPYREPAPVPPDPYLVAWAKLRRRRHALLASLCGMGTVVCLSSSMLPRGTHPEGFVFGVFLSIPLGLFILARVPPFLCPACGHPFFELVGGELGHATKCDHCDIEIGLALNHHASSYRASPSRVGARQVLVLFGWLLTAVLAWIGAFAATLTSPWMGLTAVGVGAVGALAVLVGGGMRRRRLPRLLVVPMVAAIVGALCGARVWRANEQDEQERQALVRQLVQQTEEITRQLQELQPKSAGCPRRVPSNR